jgi:hypothetical protein
MNKTRLIILFSSLLILFNTGCEQEQHVSSTPARNVADSLQNYQPTSAIFLPLTNLKQSAEPHLPDTITAYIALQDSARCAVKAPAVFRFELYEFVPLSPEPKGKRLHIWPDIDLTSFRDNNEHWRDYLRAYEFEFSRLIPGQNKYILEVTCICPTDRRLTATTTIRK